MIKEIRQKSKSLREAEEKVETLKKREVQIRETCDAWKKEVFCSIFYCCHTIRYCRDCRL